MSRNAEDCENSGLLPQLESEPEVEQIGEAPEEVPFEIPKKWKWMNFDCVVKTFPSKNYQIQTKEIALEGKYPVISQAKAKIDGYCNDESKLIPRDKIPFVIFGDHTRVVKFVNRQCVIGADGTKLLRSDVYDISFLFYVIFFLAPNLREAGYSRHFKFLRARALPVPPLAEQRRIVARLDVLLAVIDEADGAYKDLQSLCESLRAKVLQKAIEGKLVPQLESEPEVEQIGEAPEEVPFEIPNKWKWVRFQDVGSFISGWTPKAEELQKVCNKGCVPYFKIADMNQQGNEIWLQKTSSFLKKSERTRTFFRGTIVYPKNGGAVFTNKRRLLNQESVVDLNTGGYVPGKFLDIGYAYNIFLGLDFRTISKGTALPTLDQTKLRNYFIPLPPLAEQRRIVARVNELLSLLDELH